MPRDLTRADLVAHQHMHMAHGPGELNFVEVWENRRTGARFIWDKEASELRRLNHDGHKDFMDAAEAYEAHVMSNATVVRRAQMQIEKDGNTEHRGRPKTGGGARVSRL